MGHFDPENDASWELWICSKKFLKIFRDERARDIKNYVNGFPQKNLFWANGPSLTHDHNSKGFF